MRRFRGLSLVGWVLICEQGFLPADEPAIPREVVRDLIKSLDAGTLAERTGAERRILDLGTGVLPLLPVIESVESVSTRESLKSLRIILERRAAKESSGPSHVSLNGDLELAEIFKQTQKQTGNQIMFAAEDVDLNRKTVRVNWDKTTFWTCLDDLCDRLELQWKFARDSAAIQISKVAAKPSTKPMIQRVGPFRLTIERVETKPVVGETDLKLLRVSARVAVEPRLRPLSLSIIAAQLKAIPHQGEPLAPWNRDAKFELPVRDGGHEVQMFWDFSCAENTDLSSLSIRGHIQCQIAAAVERIVFDQTSLTKGTIRRRGGVSVRLRDVNFTPLEPEQIDAEIGVAVSYDTGGPAFESHKTWIFHNAVYLESKSIGPVSYTDFDTAQQSDGAVAVDYRWRMISGPVDQYSFVYEAPTLIIDVPLEVDISDISVTE